MNPANPGLLEIDELLNCSPQGYKRRKNLLNYKIGTLHNTPWLIPASRALR